MIKDRNARKEYNFDVRGMMYAHLIHPLSKIMNVFCFYLWKRGLNLRGLHVYTDGA